MTLLRYRPWTIVAPTTDDRPVALLPRVESREQADRYLLRADLPGVRPEDIEITAQDGVLTLKARRMDTEQDGQVQFTYQRSFALPEDANPEAIEARSGHGVLEISVAKQAKAQPRRIQVAAA